MRLRDFLLALVGVLLVCIPLFSADEVPFSVGIISLQEEASPYLALAQEAGTSYASTFLIPDEGYRDHLASRELGEKRLAQLKEISSAYASKSEQRLETALKVPDYAKPRLSDRVSVTYREIPLQKGYHHLLNSFPGSRSWFASQHGLDALLLIQQSKLAANDRLRIYWYDLFTDTTHLIFDQVVIGGDTSVLQEEVGKALLAKTTGPEYGLLIFDDYSSSTLIEANGEALAVQGGQVLLPFGQYTLNMTQAFHEPALLSITVMPNTITHISSALNRIPLKEMRLSSPQGKVSWFVDGVLYGNRCELSISASLVPLVVVAQKEGFSPLTLQIQKPFEQIEVPLQPEWMERTSLLESRQEGFYKSLRNTMLVFGLYVASSTLSETFEVANPLWQPLQVATSGFALVSTLHTIMNLASYAALAGTGIR